MVARGPPVEVPAGEPFSLWGKSFDAEVLIFLILRVFSYNGLFLHSFLFPQIEANA